MEIGLNLILAVAAAVAIGVIAALVVIMVFRNSQAKNPEVKSREIMDAILTNSEEYDGEMDSEENDAPRRSPFDRWNRTWGKNLNQVSSAFTEDDPKAGFTVIAIFVAITAAVTFFFQNVIAGAMIGAIVVFSLYVLLKNRASKRDDVIRQQLTGFLYALKSNISANETPERALMKVVDEMAEPLHSELVVAKNQILSNVGFSEAMAHMREETTSEDLRFLCSCMIQASSTGTSLEGQIDTILDSVEKKRRSTEEIAQATKSSNMSMYASAIILPAGFIGVYILDDTAKDYWFVDPTSWIALAVAAAIFFVGIRQARKFVGKVKEL